MSKTIRYSEGHDVRAERKAAHKVRQARRFPVRATIYAVDTFGVGGWDRVEVRS